MVAIVEPGIDLDTPSTEPRDPNLPNQSPVDKGGAIIARVYYSTYGAPRLCVPADINHDGELTFDDRIAYARALSIATSNTGDYLRFRDMADMDRNGIVDPVADSLAFDAAYNEQENANITSRLGNLPLYAGYWWDVTLQLYHVRHRAYDPHTGRWLQRDPIGYAAGMNLYAYVNNQPSGFVDPMGLDAWWIGDAARYIGAEGIGDYLDDVADGIDSTIDHIAGNPFAENAEWTQNIQNAASQQWTSSIEDGHEHLGNAFSNRLNSEASNAALMDSVVADLSFASYNLATGLVPAGGIASGIAGSAAGKAANSTLISVAVQAGGAATRQTALREIAASVLTRATALRSVAENLYLKVSGQVLRTASAKASKDWKLKISGTAQSTSPGHAVRTYREAIREAKDKLVKEVHIDHGYNRALGLKPGTIKPNRRPDVLSIYYDGTVKRIEVKSRSDTYDDLFTRNEILDSAIRREGFIPTRPKVVDPS